MLIHGKERKFNMTVGAARKIAKLCPDGKIENLNLLLASDNTVEIIDKVTELMVILNEGYELKEKYENPGHVVDVLTVEELQTLDIEELKRLQIEAFKTIKKDQKPDVEIGKDTNAKNASGGQV